MTGPLLSVEDRRSLAQSIGLPATRISSTSERTAIATEALVAERGAGAASVTSVGDSATSTTLLAAQAARVGATFFNDSTAILYIKCGATASTTSYTVQVGAGGYWEMPLRYVGVIDGIWASDAGGSVRITEFV